MISSTISETERTLIASLVLEPSQIDHVAEQLSGAEFADSDLGEMYTAIVNAHQAGLPVGDAKILLPELQRVGVDKMVANASFLGRIFLSGVGPHAKHYAADVQRDAVRRRLSTIGEDLCVRAVDIELDPASTMAWLEARLATLGHNTGAPCLPIGEIAADYLETLRRRETRANCVMSGLLTLDESIGGWMPGELVILAARTSVGKTALATQMALFASAAGKRVLFISLEMESYELVNRILCGAARVDSRQIRTGEYDDDDLSRMTYQASKIHDHELFIWAPSYATTGRIRAMCRRIKAMAGLDLLVVDYLQLLRPMIPKSKRYEEVSDDTAALKAIARELQVPVISLAQLNRQADGARPRLAHLRESGSIEQDADAVIFLHQEKPLSASYTDCDTDLIVAKHRHACTGEHKIRWIPARTRFEDKGDF